MKTHFIKKFNIALMASKSLVFTFTLFKILIWFASKISNSSNLVEQLPFSLVFDLSVKVAMVSYFLFSASIITIMFFITNQLIERVGYGALRNIYLSVFKTIETRKYLHQRVRIGDKHTIDEVLFNKSLKHLFVDITNDKYTVFIKYPSTEQADRFFTDRMDNLIRRIKSKNPDLVAFSKVFDDEDGLWIVGDIKDSE
ncbi:MAG: hypothetical protein LBE23_00440 [Vagococcus sp.]|jgi:hypothetical protein|nr:hypothetical protein [Vagococcus sp.]